MMVINKICVLLLLGGATLAAAEQSWLLPVRTSNRASWETVRLSPIGQFGLMRKARLGIPAHLHAGVDIARPSENYRDEPIYPAHRGRVVSVRGDGPYGQVIVDHGDFGKPVWTAYEHVLGIIVLPGDEVAPEKPIGRFMTRRELKRWGWHFDHVHFEILKIRPRPFPANARLPYYHFYTYNLECYTPADLHRCYHDPEIFLKDRWKK